MGRRHRVPHRRTHAVLRKTRHGDRSVDIDVPGPVDLARQNAGACGRHRIISRTLAVAARKLAEQRNAQAGGA